MIFKRLKKVKIVCGRLDILNITEDRIFFRNLFELFMSKFKIAPIFQIISKIVENYILQ